MQAVSLGAADLLPTAAGMLDDDRGLLRGKAIPGDRIHFVLRQIYGLLGGGRPMDAPRTATEARRLEEHLLPVLNTVFGMLIDPEDPLAVDYGCLVSWQALALLAACWADFVPLVPGRLEGGDLQLKLSFLLQLPAHGSYQVCA